MRKFLPFALALGALAISSCTVNNITIEKQTVIKETYDPNAPKPLLPSPVITPHYCTYTKEPITVDGVREKAWDQATPIKSFRLVPRGETPTSRTVGRMLYDDKYIYVLLEAEDHELIAEMEERDSNTCQDDVLEIFIAYGPAASASYYVNFEINVIGAVYDGYHRTGYGSEGYRPPKWTCEGLLIGTKYVGTLNQENDDDDGWTLEVAIPFESLPWMKGRTIPIDNEEWSCHLSRYDYGKFVYKECELSSSSFLTAVNFHMPWQNQPLIFKKQE